jgi:hypothetical protein
MLAFSAASILAGGRELLRRDGWMEWKRRCFDSRGERKASGDGVGSGRRGEGGGIWGRQTAAFRRCSRQILSGPRSTFWPRRVGLLPSLPFRFEVSILLTITKIAYANKIQIQQQRCVDFHEFGHYLV